MSQALRQKPDVTRMLVLECTRELASAALVDVDDKRTPLLRAQHFARGKTVGEALPSLIYQLDRELASTQVPEFDEAACYDFGLSTKLVQSIDVIAVAEGPGSFTGTRIAIAVASGLSFALKKPLVGVSNFSAIHYSALLSGAFHDGDAVTVVISARHGNYFASDYGTSGNDVDHRVVQLDQIANHRLCCYASDLVELEEALPQLVGKLFTVMPGACQGIASAAMRKLDEHPNWHDIARPTPIYLREPNAQLPNAQLSNPQL